MKISMRSAALFGLALFCWLEPVAAQDLHPSRRPSPMGMARITLADTYVRVVYSRPYKRDRDNIFGTEDSGALVPSGKIWRTGANEATEITVTDDVVIGGQRLAAGTYSVFTTPGAETWKIHFNSELGLSGTGRFNSETQEFEALDLTATDVVVVEATVQKSAEEIDQFTIAFEPVDEGAHMKLQWIDTEVAVPITLP